MYLSRENEFITTCSLEMVAGFVAVWVEGVEAGVGMGGLQLDWGGCALRGKRGKGRGGSGKGEDLS